MFRILRNNYVFVNPSQYSLKFVDFFLPRTGLFAVGVFFFKEDASVPPIIEVYEHNLAGFFAAMTFKKDSH